MGRPGHCKAAPCGKTMGISPKNIQNMRLIKSFVLIVILLAAAVPAAAQRLIPGQWEFSFGAGFCPVDGRYSQADVSFNKVNYGSKMLLRLGAVMGDYGYVSVTEGTDSEGKEFVLETDVPSLADDIFAGWGYQWCVLNTRSRNFNLWVGGTFDAGARIRSAKDKVQKDLLPASSVLLGVTPELSAELFPAKSFSFEGYFQPRMRWFIVGSGHSLDKGERWFYPSFGLRMHFYMFVGR